MHLPTLTLVCAENRAKLINLWAEGSGSFWSAAENGLTLVALASQVLARGCVSEGTKAMILKLLHNLTEHGQDENYWRRPHNEQYFADRRRLRQ